MRLGSQKGVWVDELPNILWAYQTTSQSGTRETPYFLAFRAEAVVLVEIGLPSYQTTHFSL